MCLETQTTVENDLTSSGKQLAGFWLTILTDQPLVSLMNCSVSEWLIRPLLQVPVVHVGGLFVKQSAGQSFSL